MFNVRRVSWCSVELCLYRIYCSDELIFYACHMCNCSDKVCLISVVSVVTVASSEESPVAMKLKKMWLKAPVPEDGDTNLGKF